MIQITRPVPPSLALFKALGGAVTSPLDKVVVRKAPFNNVHLSSTRPVTCA
jgi:hypothetical protein